MKDYYTYINNKPGYAYRYSENSPFYQARKAAGLSKSKLCRLSGISWNVMTSLEEGAHSPSYQTLVSWLAAFGVDLEEIIKNVDMKETVGNNA